MFIAETDVLSVSPRTCAMERDNRLLQVVFLPSHRKTEWGGGGEGKREL